jgi:hypothetical protein
MATLSRSSVALSVARVFRIQLPQLLLHLWFMRSLAPMRQVVQVEAATLNPQDSPHVLQVFDTVINQLQEYQIFRRHDSDLAISNRNRHGAAEDFIL